MGGLSHDGNGLSGPVDRVRKIGDRVLAPGGGRYSRTRRRVNFDGRPGTQDPKEYHGRSWHGSSFQVYASVPLPTVTFGGGSGGASLGKVNIYAPDRSRAGRPVGFENSKERFVILVACYYSWD